jgi:hypothetical protein
MTTQLRGPSRDEVLSRAAAFINPEHLTSAALDGIGDWMNSSPGTPLALRNFLTPATAESMGAAMRALPAWGRVVTAYRNNAETFAIDERDWPQHPNRAACHFVAHPVKALGPGVMAAGHQQALRRFLAFAITTDWLRDWIALATGAPLGSVKSAELAAYGPGDQITAHQDLYPGRIVGGNFYLDEAYQPGTGARLGYRVTDQGESFVDPVFNTLSLFAIRPDAWHWVEPYRGAGRGRYTVSIGFHTGG